jgi:hypothetical protein
MKKPDLLTVINELNSMMMLDKVSTIQDMEDTRSQLALTCLKLTSEECSQVFDWIEQLRKFSFVIDHKTGWNDNMRGYDLQVLTDGLFDRFTSSYIYDTTNKKIIPEIKADDKIKTEMNSDTYFYRFFRSGNFLIFQPDVPDGVGIEFYYQTGVISYIGEGGNLEYLDKLDNDLQYLILDDKLILRGAASRYRISTGYDNSREQQIYMDYMKLLQGSHNPQGVLNNYNTMYGFGEAVDIMGIPLY